MANLKRIELLGLKVEVQAILFIADPVALTEQEVIVIQEYANMVEGHDNMFYEEAGNLVAIKDKCSHALIRAIVDVFEEDGEEEIDAGHLEIYYVKKVLKNLK